MNVNERIRDKLRNMEQYVRFLRQYDDIALDELEDDYALRSAIERNFQKALETTIEIAEMIIAKEGYKKPETYAETMTILGDENVLPGTFADRFGTAVKFRNVLVHQYAEVDIAKLHNTLTTNLADFDTFAKHIATYLDEQEE